MLLDDKHAKKLHRRVKELLIRGQEIGLNDLEMEYMKVRIIGCES
jgi:hypothetical protein